MRILLLVQLVQSELVQCVVGSDITKILRCVTMVETECKHFGGQMSCIMAPSKTENRVGIER